MRLRDFSAAFFYATICVDSHFQLHPLPFIPLPPFSQVLSSGIPFRGVDTMKRAWLVTLGIAAVLMTALMTPAQQITDTRDWKQTQDEAFAKLYKEWTGEARYGSPLVDHLPIVDGDADAEGRARLLRRRAAEAHLLRRHPEILSRAGSRDAARQGGDGRQVRRGARAGRGLGVLRART